MDWIKNLFGLKSTPIDEIVPTAPVPQKMVEDVQEPLKVEVVKPIPKSSSIEIPGSFKLNDTASSVGDGISDTNTSGDTSVSPPERGFCIIENSPPSRSDNVLSENVAKESIVEETSPENKSIKVTLSPMNDISFPVEDAVEGMSSTEGTSSTEDWLQQERIFAKQINISQEILAYEESFLIFKNLSDTYIGEDNKVHDTNLFNFVKIIEGAWAWSPEQTIDVIFTHAHDEHCEEIFKRSIEWLLNEHPRVISENLRLFTMKNIWLLAGTQFEYEVVKMYARVLTMDIERLNSGEAENIQKIGSAALYAPTQQSSLDRKFKIVSKLIKEMNTSNKKYRTEILNPLRAYLKELSEPESYTRN